MKYFSLENDIDIAYQISGKTAGPKMVLIHGLYVNSDSWKFQLDEFEKDFHILRFDLRGHGRTTKPKKSFKIRNYVDDMKKLLDNLGWTEELYIVGHSLGGMIALVYSLEKPSQVRKLVVADSFCFVAQEAVEEVLGRINGNTIENYAIIISQRGLIPYDEEVAQFVAKIVTDHMTKQDCLTATEASAGFNICEDIKNLQPPTLLIVGEKDITTPVWASKMLDEWIPNSELFVIPDAGHLTILDHPREFNNLVLDFWKK
jgi:3-oxoadipate enol-lactonase